MKLRITILKYHSWYLCQISLQIMLLPILTLLQHFLPYPTGLLLTHKNGNFGVVTVRERRCAATISSLRVHSTGTDLGEGAGGTHPLPPEVTCGFLIQLVLCIKICLRHQSITSFLNGAPPPKKNPGSAPVQVCKCKTSRKARRIFRTRQQ